MGHDVNVYKARFEAFGWNAIIVDGHSVSEVCKAFHDASAAKGKPTALVAKTLKGVYSVLYHFDIQCTLCMYTERCVVYIFSIHVPFKAVSTIFFNVCDWRGKCLINLAMLISSQKCKM